MIISGQYKENLTNYNIDLKPPEGQNYSCLIHPAQNLTCTPK